MTETKQTIFERMGGTYPAGEDGLLYPDLLLNEAEPHYGKYGSMRRSFLRQHRKGLYSELLLTGKLVAHLNQVDDACEERLEQAMEAMAKAEGVTDALKAADQMEWVRRMNSIHNRAEEAICRELIYE